MKRIQTLALLLSTLLLAPAAMTAADNKTGSADPITPKLSAASSFVYIGTYTGPKSKGIYACRMNPADGGWTSPELVAEVTNPSFLVAHPNGRFLYAVSETGGSGKGSVYAYRIEPGTGKLTPLNRQSSGGDSPCHLAVDKTGQCLIVANYGSGSVSAFPIAADGSLGGASSFLQHDGSSVNPQRQKEPHAHCVAFDRDNHIVLVADLGIDKVLGYKFSTRKAELDFQVAVTADLKPGAGPRHIAFHPNGRYLYVVDELDSTLTVFGCRSLSGVLKSVQAMSTLPPDFHGESFAAELEIHPSGKFLYASNRGHDSIAVFSIDDKTGKLAWVQAAQCPGKTPRHFKIDPTGRFLYAALQNSDVIAAYAIEPATGCLTATGQKSEVGAPVCVLFVPAH